MTEETINISRRKKVGPKLGDVVGQVEVLRVYNGPDLPLGIVVRGTGDIEEAVLNLQLGLSKAVEGAIELADIGESVAIESSDDPSSLPYAYDEDDENDENDDENDEDDNEE